MRKHNKQIFELPGYPILLAIYFILAYTSVNVRQIHLSAIIRPLLICFLFSILIFIFFKLILKDWNRAAAFTALFLILFFTYGHLYQYLKLQTVGGLIIGRHRFLIPVYLLIAVIILNSLKKIKETNQLTLALNIFALFLFSLSVIQIGQYYYSQSMASKQVTESHNDYPEVVNSETKRDIYYIIVDTYAREDALLEIGFDNSQFISDLESRGFYIARCSESNYFFTSLSLASSLNMDYVQAIDADFGSTISDDEKIDAMIKHGRVRTILEQMGYQSIAFYTGYFWSSWQDADVYLTSGIGANYLLMNSYLSPFEAQFIKTTALVILTDTQAILQPELYKRINFPYYDHLQRQLYIMDEIQKIPERQGAKFVFAHLLLPHYPYIFAADGSLLSDTNYWNSPILKDYPSSQEYFRKGYTGQIQYLNTRLLEIVDEIIRKTEPDPIIIIQGDTGGWHPYRQAILNAYYMPGDHSSALYPTISPINSFRVIMNEYFGMNYPILPDEAYYSQQNDPFNLTLTPKLESDCE